MKFLAFAVILAANAGDVVLLDRSRYGLVLPVPGDLVHLNSSAQILSREMMQVGAVTTDAELNLYLLEWDRIHVRDRFGRPLRTLGLPFGGRTMLVDRSGSIYVAAQEQPILAKLERDGTLLRTWPIRIRRMDLASDQCTLVYADFDTLWRKNLCTDGPPVDLHQRANGLRVRRDGTIVTTIGTQIRVFTMEGRLLHLIDHGEYPALALALADEESLWLLSSELRRVRSRDGALIARSPSLSFAFAELAVYGEPRAANAPDPVPDVPALGIGGALLLAAALVAVALTRNP